MVLHVYEVISDGKVIDRIITGEKSREFASGKLRFKYPKSYWCLELRYKGVEIR